MTRDEAIKILKAIRVYECYPKSASEETKEAIDMAIEALQREEAEAKGYCHRIKPKEYFKIDDMVKVVRCKECKHWSGNEKMHNNHLCKRAQDQNIDYWTRGDDFCSYGERKGGGDE